MNQHVSSEAYEPAEFGMLEPAEQRPSALRKILRFFIWLVIIVAILGSALAAWFRLGGMDRPLPSWVPTALSDTWEDRADWSLPSWVPTTLFDALRGKPEAPASAGPVIYYRDPDGEPFYSADPETTEDGRDYLPVRSGEDVSFDDPPLAVAAASESPSQETGENILYYRNPMGLPDTSPVPKKDSMGMDYIPVYEGEIDDTSSVTVSPGKLQRTGVRTEPATRRALVQPVRVPGIIQLDERRITVVATRAEAFVEEVASVTTGEPVTKGQPLVRLYSPEIAAAGAQYLTDLKSGEQGARLGGARQRLENLGMPVEAIAELENTRKVPLAVTFTAPRAGVVLERNVVDGMRSMPGDVMFRVADVSVVWALVDIAERDLPMVAVGQTVTVRPRGYVDRIYTGKIALIYPQINMTTRTARVRIELANPDGVLLADMYVEAEVATGAAGAVGAVPTSAVIDSGDRQVVVVDKGEGRFEPRDVKLGARGEGFIEIREGIAEGDQVVTIGNFLIDAESNLKAALFGLTAQEQPQ